MDRQSTAKTAKIGSLENFRPYGNIMHMCMHATLKRQEWPGDEAMLFSIGYKMD